MFKSAVVDAEVTHYASSDIRVVNSKAEHLDELTHSRPGELPVDGVHLPEPPGSLTKVRPGTLVVVSSTFLVLMATAVSIYLYRGHTAQAVQTQAQMRDVIGVSTASKPEDAARSDGEAERPAPDAATTAIPLPVPDAEIKNADDPSVTIKCEPAVATLGLCNLDSQKEKP